MVQSDDRYGTTVDDLLEHSSRSYRGQLIRITNQNQSGIGWYCSKQPVCQEGIHHGDFVNQDQICIEHSAFCQRSIFPCFDAQGFMDRRSRKPGGFLHPLRRLSGRRTAYNRRIRIFRPIQIQQCFLDSGLAGAGTAGDNAELLGQGHLNGFLLLRGQFDVQLPFLAENGQIQMLVGIYLGTKHLNDMVSNIVFYRSRGAAINILVIANKPILLN